MNTAQKRTVVYGGFTLIELLIVVSIITIITGATIPNFNTYIQNQNVKQAQEQVKDDIRTTQNRALNGEEVNTLVNGNPALYWGIRYTANAKTYEFFISSGNANCNPDNTKLTIKTSNPLPADTVIRSNSGCMFFTFENSDATFRPAAAATVIIGPPTVATGCRRLIISANGLITVNTANVACT